MIYHTIYMLYHTMYDMIYHITLLEVYPDEYPSQTGTRIILKVKPEPVAGNPGFQTNSNGFNEYSGKPGYSDNPFSSTIIQGQYKRATMHTYYDLVSKPELTVNIKQQQQSITWYRRNQCNRFASWCLCARCMLYILLDIYVLVPGTWYFFAQLHSMMSMCTDADKNAALYEYSSGHVRHVYGCARKSRYPHLLYCCMYARDTLYCMYARELVAFR